MPMLDIALVMLVLTEELAAGVALAMFVVAMWR
jgi:hypothetical protein